MWRTIDRLAPAGTSHSEIAGGNLGVVPWIIAGVAVLFTLLLIFDAILVWDRNQRRFNPRAKRDRFSHIKRFLAWLFYPSFQAYFKSED